MPDIGVIEDLKKGHLVCLCQLVNVEPTPVYALHVYDSQAPKSVQEIINTIQATFALTIL